MNALLVRAMGAINGFIAICIMIAALVFGLQPNHSIWQLIVSLVVGFLFAVSATGTIAAIVQIERHLREIKESLNTRTPIMPSTS